MARTGGHSFRMLILAIAAITGFAAAGALLATRTPVTNATLTLTRASAATSANITIVGGACAGGGIEFCFKPESLTVAVGTKVVWKNQTGIGHTTSSCTPTACSGAPANTGSNTWSISIAAAAGSTATFTFTSPGTYIYYCMIHGYVAMHGKIIVGNAGNAPTVSKFSPLSGPTGTRVTITGHNLSGATHVTFNGTSATITSDSATKIVVKVPTGATTGHLAVTTSGGTAMSSKVFTVT
jgi:plastocyanin